MRRFFLGVAVVLMTVCTIVLLGMGLARAEKASAVPAAQTVETTVPETTAETTLPPQTEEARMEYTEVPRYFQTDYPYVKFGNGTISTSGCSVTCLAMVATYLADQEYTPDGLAYHIRHFGKNNIERLDCGLDLMQIPYERCSNVQEVFPALQEGKVVIAMMDDESVFTDGQHFIVLTGMTEDGRVLVNDPMEPNYTATEYLKDGFANGFSTHAIVSGFSGAWVFDKTAMPENYYFDGSKPQQQENRYRGYELTEEDIYMLACFAMAQDAEAEERTQQAFLEVVLNRVVSEDYPNTVRGVIYQTEMYSLTDEMRRIEPTLKEYRAVTAAVYGPYVLDENVCFYSPWEKRGEPWGNLEEYTFFYGES